MNKCNKGHVVIENNIVTDEPSKYGITIVNQTLCTDKDCQERKELQAKLDMAGTE